MEWKGFIISPIYSERPEPTRWQVFCPGPFTGSVAELEVTLWFLHQVPRHEHEPKRWAIKPLSHSDFLTKMPTTGAFAITLYRMDTTPTCYLTGWLRLAKKPPWPHSNSRVKQLLQKMLNSSPRTMSSHHVPRAHPVQMGLAKAPLHPWTETGFMTLALKKLHFSSTVATFQFYFNHDIGMYFPILTTASKCYCQQFLMTALVCAGQSATLTYFVVAIRAYNNCN